MKRYKYQARALLVCFCALALLFSSSLPVLAGVGIQVNQNPVSADSQNLFYGNITSGGDGNLLLLQNPSETDRFRIDSNGNVDLNGHNIDSGGNIDAANFCNASGGSCFSAGDVDTDGDDYIGNSGSHAAGGSLNMNGNGISGASDISMGAGGFVQFPLGAGLDWDPSGDNASMYVVETGSNGFDFRVELADDQSSNERFTIFTNYWNGSGSDRNTHWFAANGSAYHEGSLTVGGNINLADDQLQNVRALQGKDWDDDTGGTDNKYRLLFRDGAHQFYNGGVVVGNYGNGTWSDLADGTLIVEGNIGVRDTSPNDELDVNGDIRIGSDTDGRGLIRTLVSPDHGSPAIEFSDNHGGGDQTWLIGANDAGVGQLEVRFQGGSAFSNSWTSEGSNLITIMDSGNVGIGTTNPAYKLHVYKNSTNNGSDLTAESKMYVSGGSTASQKVALQATAQNQGGTVGTIQGISAQGVGVSGSTSNAIGLYAEAWGAPGNNNWAGYFGPGNVYMQNDLGIGTANPQEKLHVNGDIRLNQEIEFYWQPAYIGQRSYNGDTYISFDADGSYMSAVVDTFDFTGNVYANTYYASNWFRAQGGSGFYFQDRGTGLRSPLDENSGDFGSVATYGNEGGYDGYSLNGQHVLMSNGSSRVGLYDDTENNWTWLWQDNDYFNIYDPDGSGISFTVDSGGNVGIGTTNPQDKLHVYGDIRIGDTRELVIGGSMTPSLRLDDGIQSGQPRIFSSNGGEIRFNGGSGITLNGNVSMGGFSGSVSIAEGTFRTTLKDNQNSIVKAGGMWHDMSVIGGDNIYGTHVISPTWTWGQDHLVLDGNRIYADGEFRVTGNCYYWGGSGWIDDDYSGYCKGVAYDIAEIIDVPKDELIEAGDVVIVGDKDEYAEISKSSYDPRVAGVYSTMAAITFKESEVVMTRRNYENFPADKHEGEIPLALSGRVPLKVTDENGPIEKGDLLTTSSIPGHAMKFSLFDITGEETIKELADKLQKNEQRRNSIIGRALEDFSSDKYDPETDNYGMAKTGVNTGKIKVLLD